MEEVIFLIILALIWIIFAVVQDLRNREIANWLNFSLIIFALGFRFFYSLFSETVSFSFFYQGLLGLGIFFALGNLLYYSRMFAGGDAKLMISLGAVLPFYNVFFDNLKNFVLFFLIFLVVGACYGFISSIIVTVKNFQPFKKEFSSQIKSRKKILYVLMVFGLVLMILGFFENLFFLFGIFSFIFPWFYIYAKSVDEACMIKKIEVKKLREGDWLYNNVKIGKKIIKAKWDGLSKKEIKEIRKKKKNVKIREGIAFSPVFLISFIILALFYFLKIDLWNFII